MIEIAIDGNDDNNFLGKERPVFVIDRELPQNLKAYRQEAQRLLSEFAFETIVIVRSPRDDFSVNIFALALFIESCHMDNNIECAVMKVRDAKRTLEQYKPYVALTIAIKYIMRLLHETPRYIYKEISGLGYLGLDIETDYLNNKIIFTLTGNEPVRFLNSDDVAGALAVAGSLKALALAHKGASIHAEVTMNEEDTHPDEEEIIAAILQNVSPWIN